MDVFVFEGARDWGLTEDNQGGNLPPERGPWKYLTRVNLAKGDGDSVGINAAQAIINIVEDGFHTHPMKDRTS